VVFLDVLSKVGPIQRLAHRAGETEEN